MKVRPEDIESVADTLFDDALNGTAIAAEIGVDRTTLWKWMRMRGLEPSQAEAIARVMDRRASALIAASTKLRRAASAARDEEAA